MLTLYCKTVDWSLTFGHLPLASFGSESVNMSEKRCKQGKSDWVLYIPLFNSLWKFKEMLATYMYVLRMCNIHYM